MARSSKIVCVLILCACLTALCAVGAYAEPVEMTLYKNLLVYNTFDHSPLISSDRFKCEAYASGAFNNNIFQTGGAANHSIFAKLGPCLEFEGENNSYYTFVPNYTYNISVVFDLYVNYVITNNNSNGYIPQSVTGLYLTPDLTQNTWLSVGDCLNLLGDFNWVEGASSFELVSDDTSGSTASIESHSYRIKLDSVFRFNDLFDFTGYCGICPMITVNPPEGYTGSSNSTTVYKPLFVSFTATYDEDGELIDDAVNEIVQGQLDAVVFGQDREFTIVSENADSSEALTSARSVLGLSDYATALTSLGASMVYQGTDFSFTFPAAENVPYLGNLWGSFPIPLKQWIDSIPPTYLTILRFLAWLGLLFSVIHLIRTVIDDFNGGEN